MEFRSSQASANARRYPEPTRANTAGPNAANAPGDAPDAMPLGNMRHMGGGKFKGSFKWVVILGVVALIVAGGWFAWSKMGGDGGVKGGQYQAVFLTNGQVYFCKLSNVNSSYVTCTDIFYLQVQQSVQPDDKNKSDSSQVSLAKLGSELHGPEDAMHISRQQVLFWENLKTDGKVAQAINNYKQQNK